MSKIIVSLSEELLKEIDTYCAEHKYNRSEFIRHAAREVLKPIRYDNTDENKRTV